MDSNCYTLSLWRGTRNPGKVLPGTEMQMNRFLVSSASEERFGWKGKNVKLNKGNYISNTKRRPEGGALRHYQLIINYRTNPTVRSGTYLAFSSRGKNEFLQAEQPAQPIRKYNSANEKLWPPWTLFPTMDFHSKKPLPTFLLIFSIK